LDYAVIFHCVYVILDRLNFRERNLNAEKLEASALHDSRIDFADAAATHNIII